MTAPVSSHPAHALAGSPGRTSPPAAAGALTPHELRALDFIRDRIGATGLAPTLEEVAAALRMHSRSNAHRIVESLVRHGLLIKAAGRLRGLALASGPRLFSVPTAALRAELARREGENN